MPEIAVELHGGRRFRGEVQLPCAATIVRAQSCAELADRRRFETPYYISSAALSAQQAAQAVRGRWGLGTRLRGVLDVVFASAPLTRIRCPARSPRPAIHGSPAGPSLKSMRL